MDNAHRSSVVVELAAFFADKVCEGVDAMVCPPVSPRRTRVLPSIDRLCGLIAIAPVVGDTQGYFAVAVDTAAQDGLRTILEDASSPVGRLGVSVAEVLAETLNVAIGQCLGRPETQRQSYSSPLIISGALLLPTGTMAVVEAEGFGGRIRCLWFPDAGQVRAAELLGRAECDLVEAQRESQSFEEQLYEAQKMEPLGRMTGGLVHDFNNLISAVLGYTDLLLEGPESAEDGREFLVGIQQAAEQASALSGQVLGFVRRGMAPVPAREVNRVVVSSMRMLKPLVGKDVHVTLELGEDVGGADVDEGRLQQLLMNLAVNARDAMPDGGSLRVATRRESVDHTCALAELRDAPGWYVVVSVADTGTGMDPTTVARIFEPFFTTKPAGKGTGLGLATVRGIVSRAGGALAVDSKPGGGTTFSVYFPEAEPH